MSKQNNEDKNPIENKDTDSNVDDQEADENTPKKKKKTTKDSRLVRRIVISLILIFVAVVGFGGYTGYQYVQDGLSPVDEQDEELREIEIPMGTSTSGIADVLEDEGIIDNAFMYTIYLRFNNYSGFQAGDYQLSPSMTLEEISEVLLTGSVGQEAVYTVTIPEGRTLEEIAELFETHANVDSGDFIEQMEDEDYIEELIEDYPELLTDDILNEDIRYPLEGYLFAATYPIYDSEASVDDIVRMMLDKSDDVLSEYYDEIAALEDKNVHDVVTLSSLVEREARDEEERRLISGVFYNRLDEGMRLETDPTVLYAHGEHKDRVLFEDLEIESPYNTYYIEGLPVGPISNFGESSLRSVLNPEDTSYLFFVAAPDGEIYYSETFEEHRDLANEHLDRDL
ncbi:UPF0755 protein [Pelagirhabdus alkalitolerans]|uniref:Endolytic murein transglycosylase n=1 Tax=Pelagirhabdus alkalitolerans TaxID=1612202 RepID=A0A1G6HSM0_9BACI|nr:endolytic transglycosylase MltG [Pelagirhabdus alkalitolerans]SDB97279.1 UPF0755 protein [Pelagirhabdus alkalitolerans]